jgi:hypothetical protein
MMEELELTVNKIFDLYQELLNKGYNPNTVRTTADREMKIPPHKIGYKI